MDSGLGGRRCYSSLISSHLIPLVTISQLTLCNNSNININTVTPLPSSRKGCFLYDDSVTTLIFNDTFYEFIKPLCFTTTITPPSSKSRRQSKHLQQTSRYIASKGITSIRSYDNSEPPLQFTNRDFYDHKQFDCPLEIRSDIYNTLSNNIRSRLSRAIPEPSTWSSHLFNNFNPGVLTTHSGLLLTSEIAQTTVHLTQHINQSLALPQTPRLPGELPLAPLRLLQQVALH